MSGMKPERCTQMSRDKVDGSWMVITRTCESPSSSAQRRCVQCPGASEGYHLCRKYISAHANTYGTGTLQKRILGSDLMHDIVHHRLSIYLTCQSASLSISLSSACWSSRSPSMRRASCGLGKVRGKQCSSPSLDLIV